MRAWAALLRDLKARGLRAPRLVIADGHLGIWRAVEKSAQAGATKKGVPATALKSY